MTDEIFLAKYKDAPFVSSEIIANDFGISKEKARHLISKHRHFGLFIQISPYISLGDEKIPAKYKVDVNYTKKDVAKKTQTKNRNYENEILEKMTGIESFSIVDICKKISGSSGRSKDALNNLLDTNKAFYLSEHRTKNKVITRLYTLIAPEKTGVDFLIEKLIGGTVTNHKKGKVYKADLRHSASDCLTPNNCFGAGSVLHTGYGVSSTTTGVRRYD